MRKITLSIVIIAVFMSFGTLPSAMAETYTLKWRPHDDPQGAFFGPGGGKIEEINAQFDTETNRLKYLVNLSLSTNNNCHSSGYTVAMLGGARQPYGQDGELAYFYVDASDLSNPVVTAYAKNGDPTPQLTHHFDGSEDPGIQPPDRLFSSLVHTDDVFEITARVEPDGSRTIGFEIDATRINDHVPLYPSDDPSLYPWEGASFDGTIGIWMKTFCSLTSTYENGWLGESLDAFRLTYGVGFLDTGGDPETILENPFCEGIEDMYWVNIGEHFSLDVGVTDARNDIVTFEYSGLADGMQFSEASGFSAQTDYSVGFDWTPGPTQGGNTYPVKIKLTDEDGFIGYCDFNVEVPLNAAPLCVAAPSVNQFTQLACDAETTQISLSANNSIDQDDVSIGGLTASWTSNCPGAQFNGSVGSLDTVLSFSTETAEGLPAACEVFLTVSDGIGSSSCSVPVNVAPCERDCLDIIGGDAEFDICNVCDGDGTSCRPQCEQIDITNTQFTVDSSALLLRAEVNRAAKLLRKRGNTRLARRQARQSRRLAKELYQEIWNLVWSFSSIQQTCTESVFCVQSSNVSQLDVLTSRSAGLRALVDENIALLRRITGRRRVGSKVLTRADRIEADVEQELFNIPQNTAACEEPIG